MRERKGLPKRIRFRLLISIPTILTTFTLGSGFLVLNLTQSTLSLTLPAKTILFITGGILAMTLLALISGIMLAYGITNPLKKLTMSAESFILEREEKLTEIKAENEIGILTTIFDKAYMSLNKFISDSHILDSLPEGIITINSNGEVTDLNRTAIRFLDWDYQQLKGRHFREAFPPSKENSLFFYLIDEGLKGREVPFQEVSLSIPGKKMDSVWMGISLPEKKKEGSREITVIFKNPKEVKAIRDQLRKTEQLALLGTLASGVAHEIRNPLGSIRGLIELISEDLPPDDQKKFYTENILKEIDRLNYLVEDILDFAQNPISRVEPTDIDQILSQSISLARYNFPEKEVEIKEDYQPGLPLIPADSERLIQAFLNLLNNAFETTPEGGKIEVRSQKSEVRNLVITISDSGPGIPSDTLERIFDPFYTTKEKGTGLGLSIAQHIITAHGGNIEVESAPGQGATFKIILPVRGKGTEAQRHRGTEAQRHKGTEVERDEDV